MNKQIINVPSALQKSLAVIRETEPPQGLKLLIATGQIQPGTKYFRMGKAKILVSPPTGKMGWHMSISRDDRYPSWDEVVAAWYSLIPDAMKREGVMHLPPLREYINIHLAGKYLADYCDDCYQAYMAQYNDKRRPNSRAAKERGS
jgi:hypothetical protein